MFRNEFYKKNYGEIMKDKIFKGIDLNKVPPISDEEIQEGIIEQSRLENEIRQKEDATKITPVSAIIFSFQNEKKKRCEKE